MLWVEFLKSACREPVVQTKITFDDSGTGLG
jgi:hypothetical protein